MFFTMPLSQLNGYGLVPIRRVGRRNLVEGDIGRDVVAGHNILHFSGVTINVVAIILARIFEPLRVSFIEVMLIVR